MHLPLITTNCAVLGAALDNVARNTILHKASYTEGTSDLLAIVLLSGCQRKIENNDIPHVASGMPIGTYYSRS